MKILNIVIVLLVVLIIAVAIAAFVLNYPKSSESYLTSSNLDNIGSFEPYKQSDYVPVYSNLSGGIQPYSNVNHQKDYNPYYPTAEYYSDSEYYDAIPDSKVIDDKNSKNRIDTVARLDRKDTALPVTSKNLTPYDVDVADPKQYSFMVNAPRVIRKDRLALQADPFRGDIPIAIYPDIPIIQKSQYDRDSLRLDGAFSEALSQTYNKLTGKAYVNQPMNTSKGDTIM